MVESSPYDAATIAGGLDAPAIRASEAFDHIQSVRTAARRTTSPGTAEILGLDQDMIRMQFGADGELAVPAPRVQDRVGGQLRGDEHRVIGGRAARQVCGHGMADV